MGKKRPYIQNIYYQGVTVKPIKLVGWRDTPLLRIRANGGHFMTLPYDDAIRLADEIYARTAEYRFTQSLKGLS